jgi:tripartite-type tricarboxylate transporter receptor subunit TctC
MRTVRLITLLCCALLCGIAAAQDYPARPVRVVIPFPPGGTVDILARAVAQNLSAELKQNFVADNRPGAAGNIAAALVAKSSADGYTLLVATINLATNSALYANLSYDPLKDFAPISILGITPNALVINPSVRANSVQELIDLAKGNPGKLNYGSAGSGTAVHLTAELFNVLAGIKVVHVPYKGPIEALTDVVAGRLDFMFPNLPVALPFVNSGKLRMLAVTSAKRHSSIPAVPTVSEAGLPGYEAIAWFGMVAPSGTPKPIIVTLSRLLGKILNSAEVKQQLYNAGIDVAPTTPEQFEAFLAGETAKWAKIIKAAGLRAD